MNGNPRVLERGIGMLLVACLAWAPIRGLAAAEPPTPAKVAVPEGESLDAETRCLALAIYWEGKAEPPEGQAAIAHTVLNRVGSGAFPKTVCGVVAEGGESGKKNACQFAWWCDGRRDEPREADSWKTAVETARAAKAGKSKDPTRGALYFHSSKVNPSWAASKKRLARIGDHVFYR